MIKAPYLPAIRIMALLAVFAELSLVLIICFVTRITFYRGFFVICRKMALLTGYNGMQANQRETGNIMLKTDFFLPPTFIVAFIAYFPLFAFMRIIKLVASVAVGFHLRPINKFLVACGTFGILVPTT